jgi:hypothetical protein
VSVAELSTDGAAGHRPGREATVGVNVPAGAEGQTWGPRRRRNGKEPEPEFRSYYNLPVINKPVWKAPDIPGYLFLGGLAGAGAAVGLCAQLTGRPALARVSKVGAAAAGHLSLVALVHDLGRRGRFLNMLRVFKATSPMSVGSWLLAGFVPAATGAALSDVTGVVPVFGALCSAGAATLGLPVSAYTAALISDTAVPAWHDGHELMPFVFVSSAASSAAGLGLVFAPVAETDPLVGLGAASGLAELAFTKLMEHHMGEVLVAGGALAAATSGRSRLRRSLAGVMLLAGSALTRFGIFQAGLTSAEDPKYTIKPQRERLERRGAGS